jgi:RimJ/RimL family protein N-acetyltransferase/N-acetylglutamate synthase-like GNAT family acetyltransferase
VGADDTGGDGGHRRDVARAVTPIEGPRVRLRRLGVADLPRFQAYRHDPEVGRWQGWLPQDEAAARAFLQAAATDPFPVPGTWFQMAIADRASDTLLGDIGLHLRADSEALELGFSLAREAQGRGLATEAVGLALQLAFDATPATRVLAITDTRNHASVRLLERLGLRRYATLDATFRDQPCQEHHYVMYRPGRAMPVLRRAGAADAMAIADVLIAARSELMPYAPSAHTESEVRAWVAERLLPMAGVTVADLHGAIVGVLAVGVRGGAGWIDQLCVHPAHVVAGIGRLLLSRALELLPRPVRLYTFQANLHARAFYESHGFVAVEFGDGTGNEEQRPDVLYERSDA